MGENESWMGGWRGAALAAALAVVCALPGLVRLPVVDRGEARFAQATAQMIDQRDPTEIRFQNSLRRGSMPAAHWMQAAAVMGLSSPEARAIWAYRLPSLLGVALLAAAGVSGARRLFGARAGLMSGLTMAISLLSMSLGGQATAEALFAGCAAAVLAALTHLYADACADRPPRKRDRMLLWAALIAGFMVKGPLILLFTALSLISLVLIDRRARWLGRLGWVWGLIAFCAITGPWMLAVTVSTDGQFWQQAHAPAGGFGLGLQSLSALLLLFPAAGLIAPAAVFAWRERKSPAVRLCLAWLVPAWVLLELTPGFRGHGAAALYLPIVWLGTAGLLHKSGGRRMVFAAALLSIVSAVVVAGVFVWLARRFGDPGDLPGAGLAVALVIAAGLAGAAAMLSGVRAAGAVCVTAALAGAWVMIAGVAPALNGLWPTRGVLGVLEQSGLDPRGGLARGPVASAGYAEPSLVFRLGSATELGDARTAAAAIADGRPAIVEGRQLAAFEALLARNGLTVVRAGSIKGVAQGPQREVNLSVYGPAPAPGAEAPADGAPAGAGSDAR